MSYLWVNKDKGVNKIRLIHSTTEQAYYLVISEYELSMISMILKETSKHTDLRNEPELKNFLTRYEELSIQVVNGKVLRLWT